MNVLLPAAETIAKRLIARHETIATAESSTGGLIAAALLAVPGASAYFLGGAIGARGAARHRRCRDAGLALGDRDLRATSGAARARSACRGLGRRRDWRNWTDRQSARHPAGHTCIAIAGPTERAITLRTGNPGRCQNMEAFATRALELLGEIIPSV